MAHKNVFKPISYSRMWKHEFRDFVFQLNEVVGKYDSEELKIEFVSDKLRKALLELDAMDIDYRKHPLTAQIQDLTDSRSIMIQSIVMHEKNWNRTSRVLAVPELIVVTPFVAKYLRPLFYTNGTVLADYLRAMFTELDASDELQTAIAALRLNELFEHLRAIQFNHTRLRSERRESQKVLLVQTEAVKAVANRAVQNLIKKVELNQEEFPEMDYARLINEVNDLSAYFTVQRKSRATSRKKSKLKEITAIESGETGVDTSKKKATAVNWDSETVALK